VTGTVEGQDHPPGSPPGDVFPCHNLDTMHPSNELIKTKNKMMPLLHIHIRLFLGGSVNRVVNNARLANRSTDCQIVEIGVSVRKAVLHGSKPL